MSVRSKSAAWRDVLPFAALLLLALIAAGPVWGPGLLNTRGGGDSPFLLLRTHQLAANLRAGVFPVRWMPDAAYGFGYPFFSYYAALPYYLAAGFHLIGLGILDAIKLTQTLFFVAAALGMYGWARRALRSRAGAWLAASAYTLAPFHLVNVYVRGDSLSEFAAFAFYPLILWGLDYLADRPTFRRALPSALAYAGLILTHNISALIFTPFILLYALTYVLRFTFHASQRSSRDSLLLFLPLLIGLLLSAWFWVPALAEIDEVQLTAQASGYFFYGGHFRGWDLVQRGAIFDYAITPDGPSPFAMGLLQAFLAVLGVFVFFVQACRITFQFWGHNRDSVSLTAQADSPIRVFACQHAGLRAPRTPREQAHQAKRTSYHLQTCGLAILGFLLSAWLITPLSRFLWDHVPLLPMVQFPWRFLSVQALFAALLAGAVVVPFQRRRRIQLGVSVLIVLLLGVASLAGLSPDYLPIAADEVTTGRLQLYELFTGNIGSTIRYEYLPRWVQPRPYTGPRLFDPGAAPRAIALSGALMGAERVERGPTHRVWQVEAGAEGAEVALPLYYWPGWRAAVDGASVDARPHPDSGYLTLDVPAGSHTVRVWLGRTPLRLGAEIISLVTVLVLIALGVVSREAGAQGSKERVTIHHSPFTIPHSPLSILCLAFLVVLGGLVVFGPRVDVTGDADLTMDFDRMPYLHHNPDGVDFGQGRMMGYGYSADELAPGDRLDLTFDWEGQPAHNAVIRLVSPATVRRSDHPPISEVALREASLGLPLPADLGPGLYLVQMKAGDKLVYLRPIWVREAEGEVAEQPVRGAFADGDLRLHAVEVSQPAPERLDVCLTWSAARPVAANYGLSLRLIDAADNEWARLDTQPGYGFRPTSLWPVDALIHDRLALSLPDGIPPGDNYTLRVILYRVASWESVGQVDQTVSLRRVTQRPDAPVIARLDDALALSQMDVPERVRQGGVLHATAYWLVVQKPSMDYVVEWELESVTDSDARLVYSLPVAPGASPRTWPAGAWIAGKATLPISSTIPPGDYQLSLTLRDPVSDVALGSYSHPKLVRVQGRERVWELPSMEREVRARFGDMIELAGYDLLQEGETLRLKLHWRALAAPDRHYMLFVHLAEPDTGKPVAQVDTMPRAFTYPTGMWVPGEVVSDEVVLSSANAPPGRYDLAVGWYNPETETRLQVSDEDDTLLPDGRFVLPDSVVLP